MTQKQQWRIANLTALRDRWLSRAKYPRVWPQAAERVATCEAALAEAVDDVRARQERLMARKQRGKRTH